MTDTSRPDYFARAMFGPFTHESLKAGYDAMGSIPEIPGSPYRTSITPIALVLYRMIKVETCPECRRMDDACLRRGPCDHAVDK